MNRDQYLSFLLDYEKMFDNIASAVLIPIEPIVRDAFGSIVAARIAQYVAAGLILDGLCDQVDLDVIRAHIMKVIHEVMKPIEAVIKSVNLAIYAIYAIKQAWDAIPTLEEYTDYLLKELQSKAYALLQEAIPALITSLICGTRFTVTTTFTLKNIISRTLITTSIIVAVKTLWEQYEGR